MGEASALSGAKKKFKQVKTIVQNFRLGGRDWDQTIGDWEIFLNLCVQVFNKLENGAPKTGRGVQWFGQLKREQKRDELVSYVRHARNADNHGISPTAEHTIELDPVPGVSQWIGKTLFIRPDAKPGSDIGHLRMAFYAIPVVDGAVTYHPPKMHDGKVLENGNDPRVIMQCMLAYLERKLSEAEAFYTD